ncbi:MAG: hypothetical protein JSR77_08430 [Planctomycetes bacterium]|nr:hypothetical protein [Planctomycetota bacterium]
MFQSLPVLAGYTLANSLVRVSGDGLTVAGSCAILTSPAQYQAFRWTAAGGIRGLGFARAGDQRSEARGISRDGRTIVGISINMNTGLSVGFEWRSDRGMVVLSEGYYASAVSADGSVIVGGASTGAVYWDAQRQAHILPYSQEIAPGAMCVSDDGKTIGGVLSQQDPYLSEAFIWTETRGIQTVRDYAGLHGITIPPDWRLTSCLAMSGDASVIGGKVLGPNREQRGYVLEFGPLCAADFNADGGIDGVDVQAFFDAWEAGLGVADVNEDGGVDGVDVDVFFHSWESGACS